MPPVMAFCAAHKPRLMGWWLVVEPSCKAACVACGGQADRMWVDNVTKEA